MPVLFIGTGAGAVDTAINFRHGLFFVNFGHTKNTEIYPHMHMQSHKKIYCTGQNDEIKSRRKLKILEKFGNVRN